MPTQQPQPITPISQLLTLLPQLEIFRAPSATPHARIPQGPARPWSLPIGAPEFGDWLLLTAQKELTLFPSVSQIRQALRSLAATANFGNHPTRPTPLRFLKTEAALSIDLGDRANIITINAAGWSITQDLQTAWLSPRTQLPLPTPEATETSLAAMLANALDLNRADSAKLSHWIANACSPSLFPQQPLVLTGPARHQAAQLLRDLIDPSATPFQKAARSHIKSETEGLHLLVFPEVTRLTDKLRRLTQPVIYTNEVPIKKAEQPLTIQIGECQRPLISQLLGALCNCISQQLANLLPKLQQPAEQLTQTVRTNWNWLLQPKQQDTDTKQYRVLREVLHQPVPICLHSLFPTPPPMQSYG